MKKKNNNAQRQCISVILRVAAPLLVIVTWYYAVTGGKINQALLPSPQRVFETLVTMLQDGKLAEGLLVSAKRVLIGFSIGAALGLVIGTFMGLSKYINSFLGSIVGILRPIPMIAWMPLLILWFGIAEKSKYVVIAIGTFWSVLLNTIHGIHSVDPKLKEVATVLEKKPITVLFKVVYPAALPGIFTGIRLGMGAAWSCVVAAEMIAATKGIGYMIMYARELSKPDVLLVGMLSIGLVGLIIDSGIMYLEKLILRWNVG